MLRITSKQKITGLKSLTKNISMEFAADYELLDTPSDSLVRDFNNPLLELIRLLKESTEIEHSLMVQYLYASFSIKPSYSQIAGSVLDRSNSILAVAIQEMQHLDSVNRFLSKLGASPNLDKQDFPFEPDIYPFEFNLEPLSKKSLAKYIYAESSATEIDPTNPANANDLDFINELRQTLGANPRLNHLGSLYHTIILVSKELQASGVIQFDIQDNINEMEKIKDEGENEHFQFFKSLFNYTHPALSGKNGIWDLPKEDVNYPSKNLPTNPSGFVGHPNQINDESVRKIAWLANLDYWIVLTLLVQSYKFQNNSSSYLFDARNHMTGPLLSLGLLISNKGEGICFDSLSLGYDRGLSEKDNNSILILLCNEAKSLATNIKTDLPSTFPFYIYDDTISMLKQLTINI